MSKVEPVRNRYVGHRYVPKIYGEWDKTKSYEGLIIVTHKGTSYTSKQHVPVGVDILNEKYWVVTGNYNVQVETYRQEVKRVEKSLQETVDKLEQVSYKTDSIVSSLAYGIVGDGTDETEKFQRLLNENAGKKIVVAYPESKLKIGQITIPSNTDLFFSYGMTVEVTSGLQDLQRWITIEDVKNVNIVGLKVKFKMLKDEYVTGEHRHCFNIIGNAENIMIEGVIADSSGGDGYYIGMPDASSVKHPKNVQLLDCVSTNNRRQGLSITSVNGFYARNCDFINTKGTAPEAGVDIEANSYRATLKNIVFDNCRALNNQGSGFVISMMRLTEDSEPINVTFINCNTSGNVRGFFPAYCRDNVKGLIRFINCTSEKERLNAFCELDVSSTGVTVEYDNTIAIDSNTNGGTSLEYSFASSYSIITLPSSPFQPRKVGGSRYNKCKSYETRTDDYKTIRRGFSIPVENAENVIYDKCESVGHTLEEITINNDNENISIIHDITPLIGFGSSGNVNNTMLGTEISNDVASGYIYRRLPKAKAGIRFMFRVESSNLFKITPQEGSIIYPLGNEENGALQSNLVGSFLEVEGRHDGNWNVVNMIGTWEPSNIV